MKRYPNTSILSIITKKNNVQEDILFIYLKPVPDFYSLSKIYWYQGKGKNGEASYVWEDQQIKQWVACGTDEMMGVLFEGIIQTKSITIGSKIIHFEYPKYELILGRNQAEKTRNDGKRDVLWSDINHIIPQEFYQKENLESLSGYKIGVKAIKSLFPLGFFEEHFIYRNLKEGIWGIKEYRLSYLVFKGVRTKTVKDQGTKEIKGFLQEKVIDAEYEAVVSNLTEMETGKGKIDSQGYFKVDLSEPALSGSIKIVRDKNILKNISFAFINDIVITTEIAQTTYTDNYGRSFMITGKRKAKPLTLDNFTWQREVYSETNKADAKLSDLFKNIIDYLGPNILIADPYFINNIKQDPGSKQPILTHCQAAFINALFHASIDTGVQSIQILGYWARAKSFADKKTEEDAAKFHSYFERYEQVLRELITINKLEKYLPPNTIKFMNAKEDFHNRYWFSYSDCQGNPELEKCLILTNSIGNINELDVMKVTDQAQQLQIFRKYSKKLGKADLLVKI